LDHIVISPNPATIVAGTTQTYIAEAFDIGNNSLGIVTGSTAFTIGSGASCTAAVCTSNIVATYTVTGTYAGKQDTATLHVIAAGLDHIVISPDPKTIVLGTSQAYTAEGFDRFGNSLGDVTGSTTFTVDGAPCTGTACGPAATGTYTVTGTMNQGETRLTDSATLIVTNVPPTASPSASPTASPTAGGTEIVEAATATPIRVTPPPTSSNGGSSDGGSLPLLILLISLGFGGLGLLAVQAQRSTFRR
jgi:hypothetical protein